MSYSHIHGIKALIDETILPAVLNQVEEHRNELDGRMDAIKDCEAHGRGSRYSSPTNARDCVTREDISKEKELTEVYCKWKTHLDKSCDYFDTCWTGCESLQPVEEGDLGSSDGRDK
eukprot:14168-Amphidinium_carterae.2